MPESAENLNIIINKLLKIKGIKKVIVLNDEVRRDIEKLEKEYSNNIIKGWGKPLNLGVYECLKRNTLLLLITDKNFKWPKGPYALIKINNEIIATIDEKGLKINKNKVSLLKSKVPIIIYPPLKPTDDIRKIIANSILASPSPLTDRYLKKIFKISTECNEIGTMLLAF